MTSTQGPPDEKTSNTTGENDVPVTAVSTTPTHIQEELRGGATTAAEDAEHSDITSLVFARIQRELESALEEQGELRQAYVTEHLDDWLIEAINDVGRLNITSPSSEEWHVMTPFLPPGLGIVNGEVVELPGVAEQRTVDRSMLRELLLEIQAEAHSEIRGDDVLSTAIRNERDQLRTRVGVLEEQLQAVSESDDPRILGVILDQTRYTTMKQQRDAYFQRVQTLEVEIERLLDCGLGAGGVSEQRMRTERDEMKYSHDELQHRVNGPDGYLAQIHALQSQVADPSATREGPFSPIAAVREELRLEKQRAKIAQQETANLRNHIEELNAGIVILPSNRDETVEAQDEASEQIHSPGSRIVDYKKGDDAQINSQDSWNQTIENFSCNGKCQISEIKDWIHKVQEYTNSAPDILKDLEDEPSSASQPATRDERRGVIAWFRGLVGLANNPPSQPSSPALSFSSGQLAIEPPPPDREDDCSKKLAQAHRDLLAAIEDANNLRECYNKLMQQQAWGTDREKQLEQEQNERDVAVQKVGDLEAQIKRLSDQVQASEACPEQLRRALSRIRELEAELLTTRENIKVFKNKSHKEDDLRTRLVQLRVERDAAVQDANTLRTALARHVAESLAEHDAMVLNATTIRTELERQVAEALAELESTRNALVASSADRDVAIAERDATLLATGRQHDGLTRLTRLMQSNDDAHSAELAQIQTALDMEVQEVARLRNELLLPSQRLSRSHNIPGSGIEEVTRLRNELGEALRGQHLVPPNDDCLERLHLAETERDTAVRVQELIAESRQEAYTERDLARAERDSLAYELDDANTDRARLQADIHRALQYDEAAVVATSVRLEGERNALIRVLRDRQQPTSEQAVILQNMGLSETAEVAMVNALASEVIDANMVVTNMRLQVDRLQTELSNLRRSNPNLPAAAPVQSDPANLLAIQAAELAHNATRRQLDQVQGELNRLRNAQAAARITFDPAVVDLQTLPDTIVLQQLLNTRDERAAQDREALHAAILTNDTGRVALEELQKKLKAVRKQRDRLLAGRGSTQIEENVDLPRQLDFTTAALERVRQQRDAMLAAASADYSLEVNLPTRYRMLLEAYDVVLDERNRLERMVAQSDLPRDRGEAANGGNDATEEAEQIEIMRSNILRDCSDAQRERDVARADRMEAEIERNAAQAMEARTAEELRTTSARLQTAQSIIEGNSATDPRDDLILQLSRRVTELAQQTTRARRREVDAVAELHFQKELALNDPLNEDVVATFDDLEARTQRAEDARLVVENARLRDIAEARGQTDIALAALGREETTSAGLNAVVVRLRTEIVARGGTVVGDQGEVERENYNEARWNEAGFLEQEDQPRIHYDPYHIPEYDINYPLREDWPPSYLPGSALLGGGIAPPELVQELSNQDDQIQLLELARSNLRERLVALGGAVVGPYGEVQGEFFNRTRWSRAGHRERDGRDLVHYDRAIPHSPFNPLRTDWPVQYQPPEDFDQNLIRNMSHDPTPRVPGTVNSDRGVGIPPRSTPNQRGTASDRIFSDPGSIDEPIIILPLPPLIFPEASRSPSPIPQVTPARIPPVRELPTMPPEIPLLYLGPRVPRLESVSGPHNTPPTSLEQIIPVLEYLIPEARTPVDEDPVEDDHAKDDPSTTTPYSPPPMEEEEEEEEGPKKKPRKPKPASAVAGPPRRSSRLATVPPADYTAGTKRRYSDDGDEGGGKKRRQK